MHGTVAGALRSLAVFAGARAGTAIVRRKGRSIVRKMSLSARFCPGRQKCYGRRKRHGVGEKLRFNVCMSAAIGARDSVTWFFGSDAYH